jgi:hydroxymethylbilane synthase
MKRKIIIGSRGSDLALWQANFVMNELARIGIGSEIKIIKTQGDKIQDIGFDKMEGKGFFTKEIEDALLAGETDLAVHSHKDLPTTSPAGLVVGAVSYREDPSELLLIRKEAVDIRQKFSLKRNAVVGTSSGRRKSQIKAFRGDVSLQDLRGNVPTRVNRLREGNYDAILLAAAGIDRLKLNLDDIHVERLSPKEFIPAPAQGVLALQVREDDKELLEALQQLNHADVQAAISVERKVLNLFEGGCQLPLGVFCEKDEDDEVFRIWASKADSWDRLPKMLYIETKRTEGVAESIVEKFKNIKPASVFITRDLRDSDMFSRVLKDNGYTVEGRSLIDIVKVPFSEVPSASWIFFSSKHAVKHFLDQNPDIGKAKLAAVGKGTSDMLRRYHKKADFIGYSTDTRLTAKQFAATVGNSLVLFPQAKGSLRSIQQQFKAGQVIDLIVYETIKKNQVPVPQADIIVFTSPSNVETFFENNKLLADQKIVAMGDATGNALKKFSASKYKLPASFDDAGLAQAVFGL